MAEDSGPRSSHTRADPAVTVEGVDNPQTVRGWERVAIGHMLLATQAEDLLGELWPDHFSTPAHHAIYAAIMAFAEGSVDQVAVLRCLHTDRAVRAVGDSGLYLSRCCNEATAAVGTFGWYAGLIRQAADYRRGRELVERADRAIRAGNLAEVHRIFEDGARGLQPPTDPDAGKGVKLRPASSFRMKGTKWLFQGRIPAGMMTILAGREGIGKSTVSLDIAARTTRGTLEGRYHGRPQNVILCATEDSWEHTIVPRLKAVGADLDKVFHISVQDDTGGARAITAPGDIRAIEHAIGETKPALMIVDPIMSIIDGKIDTHVQAQVQQGLEPLIALCQRATMAVVGLIHVNKSTGSDALNTIMGSKAFATLPRSVLFCIADPDDEDTYLFSHEKCNVGPKVATLTYRLCSVRFDLDPAEVEPGDAAYIVTSKVVWGGEDERRASDVLADMAASNGQGKLRRRMREFIDAQTGVVSTLDLIGEFQDGSVSRANIDMTLTRMVKKGEVVNVGRGLFQSGKLAARG